MTNGASVVAEGSPITVIVLPVSSAVGLLELHAKITVFVMFSRGSVGGVNDDV